MASLKKAIHAYGRAKESEKAATRRHIISEARRLKHPELIPEGWLTAAGVLTAAPPPKRLEAKKTGPGPVSSDPRNPTPFSPAAPGEANDDSGYKESDHPRGIDGTWIEKGGDVNYVDPETGEESRATVTGFDGDGNAILKFKESGETRTISKEQVGDTVKGAPKRMATLWRNPNEGGKEDEAKKKGKGGGGGGGGGGGKSDADKAAADKAKADKAAVADKAKADKQAVADKAKVDKQTTADKAAADKAAAKQTADQAKAAKLADTTEGKRVVLPSDATEGATVNIGTNSGDWTVTKAYTKPDGTQVVDIVSADGQTETGYPVTGPKGKRLTQAEAKLRVKKRGNGQVSGPPAAAVAVRAPQPPPSPVVPLATKVRPGQVSRSPALT